MLNLRNTKNDLLAIRLYKADESPFSIIYQSGSRASGINQSLLSHYVNGLKKPCEQQRKRIVDGLHKIGSDLLSVMCV